MNLEEMRKVLSNLEKRKPELIKETCGSLASDTAIRLTQEIANEVGRIKSNYKDINAQKFYLEVLAKVIDNSLLSLVISISRNSEYPINELENQIKKLMSDKVDRVFDYIREEKK